MNSTIPMQAKEECLCEAFIHAIASYAGINVQWRDKDFGIDGSFKKVIHHGQRYIETGIPLDFQLKATINWNSTDEHIVYDMESKTYNDFIYLQANASSPVRLILLCLPKDIEQWLSVEPEQLLLKHCCYFHSINGDATENVSTIRVNIPRENVLTPLNLKNLMDSIQNGGAI